MDSHKTKHIINQLNSIHNQPNPKSSLILSHYEYKNGHFFGKVNSDNQFIGVCLLIYDTGDILICNFQHGNLQGGFCCFNAQIKLWIGGYFNQIIQTGFVYYKSGQGKWIDFINDHCVIQTKFQEGTYLIPSAPHDNQTYWKRIPPNPTTFIQSLIQDQYGQSDNKQSLSALSFFQLSNKELYFGVIQQNKPSKLGIMLVKNWPVCYGNFKEGQLSGLGRVQQRKDLIIDGIFENSKMKKGWMLQFHDNQTCYGEMASNGKQLFIIKQAFTGFNYNKINEFRRKTHLKSVDYKNSHLVDYLTKIKQYFQPCHFESKRKQIQKSNRSQPNFMPSFISQISRVYIGTQNKNGVNRNTDESEEDGNSVKSEKSLIDLINDYNQTRILYQKNSQIIINQKQSAIKQKSRTHFMVTSTKSTQGRGNNIQKGGAREQKNVLVSNSILNTERYAKEIQKDKFTNLQTKKALNLHDMYSKYLKK